MSAMDTQVVIDGNNLLHAMHAHAPLPAIGRETLVRIIERWAESVSGEVVLVFDGSVPDGGLAAQMSSKHMAVRFGGAESADDVIIRIIGDARDPGRVRIVSSDKAILHIARHRRCRVTDSVSFTSEVFAPRDQEATAADRGTTSSPPVSVKPQAPAECADGTWLEDFGVDADDALGASDVDAFSRTSEDAIDQTADEPPVGDGADGPQ